MVHLGFSNQYHTWILCWIYFHVYIDNLYPFKFLRRDVSDGREPHDDFQVITRVENDDEYRNSLKEMQHAIDSTTGSDAVLGAAKQIANTMKAKAIVVCTLSGTTALRAAQKRPSTPLLAITPSIETARSLALSWGKSH